MTSFSAKGPSVFKIIYLVDRTWYSKKNKNLERLKRTNTDQHYKREH